MRAPLYGLRPRERGGRELGQRGAEPGLVAAEERDAGAGAGHVGGDGGAEGAGAAGHEAVAAAEGEGRQL